MCVCVRARTKTWECRCDYDGLQCNRFCMNCNIKKALQTHNISLCHTLFGPSDSSHNLSQGMAFTFSEHRLNWLPNAAQNLLDTKLDEPACLIWITISCTITVISSFSANLSWTWEMYTTPFFGYLQTHKINHIHTHCGFSVYVLGLSSVLLFPQRVGHLSKIFEKCTGVLRL